MLSASADLITHSKAAAQSRPAPLFISRITTVISDTHHKAAGPVQSRAVDEATSTGPCQTALLRGYHIRVTASKNA